MSRLKGVGGWGRAGEGEREGEAREGEKSAFRGKKKKAKEKAIDRLPLKISYWISLTETTAF